MAAIPLDLHDIQGNILRGYSRESFGRFLFLRIGNAAAGRKYMEALAGYVTTADWGDKKPEAMTNIALSHAGLRALGLSYESAGSFPSAFREGMRARAASLGDIGESAPEHWDDPWCNDEVHLLVGCYASNQAQLDAHCRRLLEARPAGVDELPPHQDAERIMVGNRVMEHFGFVDGLSNPAVAGMPGRKDGNLVGNPDGKGSFVDVPAGEFILGYPGLGREQRDLPVPGRLAVNGTFLVFRKLAQNVKAFRDYTDDQHKKLRQVFPGVTAEFIAAKMVGRWPDGTPLVRWPEKQPCKPEPTNQFDYTNDPEGAQCPLGAHIRRANPRSSQGVDGDLTKRRRMIRRGIPYGTFVPKDKSPDNSPRGVLFLAYMAGIESQFEFVQREWINYGNDFRQGNDKDPLVGDNNFGRMVVPGDERTGRPPVLCTGLPRFVTVKGGGYFFVPGLTALRLIAAGRLQ